MPIKIWFNWRIPSLQDIMFIKFTIFPNLFYRILAKMKSVEFSVDFEIFVLFIKMNENEKFNHVMFRLKL